MNNDKQDKNDAKSNVHLIKSQPPRTDQDRLLEERRLNSGLGHDEAFANTKSLPNENIWKMQAPDPWTEPKDQKGKDKKD